MEKETLKSQPARSSVSKQQRRRRLPPSVNFFSPCLFCYSSDFEEEHITEEKEETVQILSPSLQPEIVIEAPIASPSRLQPEILTAETPPARVEAPISLSVLPAEILFQILNKLPIRCALRCQSVCKLWRCLISDPLFKSTFNNANQPLTLIPFPQERSKKNPHPVLSYEIFGSDSTNPLVVAKPWRLPADFNNFPVTDITVLGSYNGLVALHHVTPGGSSHSFCLFNPITMEKKLVRLRFPQQFWDHFWRIKFCCNASGLCHDAANDEYKVVVISSKNYLDTILVVSFKDNSWKYKPNSIPESFTRPLITGMYHIGTTVEGTPYWICDPGIFRSRQIVYFDWQKEKLRVAELPKKASVRGLGALDGKLTVALAEWGMSSWGKQFEVWALNKDGWRLLFVMPMDTCLCFKLLWWRKDEWVIYASEEGMLIHHVFRKKTAIGQLQFSTRTSSRMDISNMVMVDPRRRHELITHWMRMSS